MKALVPADEVEGLSCERAPCRTDRLASGARACPAEPRWAVVQGLLPINLVASLQPGARLQNVALMIDVDYRLLGNGSAIVAPSQQAALAMVRGPLPAPLHGVRWPQ